MRKNENSLMKDKIFLIILKDKLMSDGMLLILDKLKFTKRAKKERRSKWENVSLHHWSLESKPIRAAPV